MLNQKRVSGRVISIEEEDDNFRLPPIKKVSYSHIGSMNNYYKKDKLKMAKQIAKQEVIGLESIEASPTQVQARESDTYD